MSEDKIFTDGLFIKDIPDSAPEYILGGYSINISKFKKWLDENEKYAVRGWLNISVKKSSKGSKYAELDLYQYKKEMEKGSEGSENVGGYERFQQAGQNLPGGQEELPTIHVDEEPPIPPLPDYPAPQDLADDIPF